jgi:hypothetical protein
MPDPADMGARLYDAHHHDYRANSGMIARQG